MSGRIIFMTEEPSMGQTLRNLLPKVSPEFREFEHWLILNHQGKSDLERSFPKKMRNWQEPGIKFIILRDNDGSDCRDLKLRMVSKAPPDTHEFQVRIVCQELKSWFPGDMQAVTEAYPAAKTGSRQNMSAVCAGDICRCMAVWTRKAKTDAKMAQRSSGQRRNG